jgi:chromosome segregation ATPase
MALNTNSQNGTNPQLLQQRLNVREQEITALKVQNRHLLGRIEELEKEAQPNQIDTQFVADEVKRTLDPVINQMKTTMNSSFEILQSTMRGIYQQSQRAEKAVADMSSQTRELEIRLNDQRKQDQNFYQDKIFSMISNFCDRLERQIEIRLKSLGTIEILSAKQNEILVDLETVKGALGSVQRNAESSRGDVSRMEKNSTEIQQKLVDVQVQTRSSDEIVRNTLQQIQNHRAEFRLIRSELKQAVETMNGLLNKVEETQELVTAGPSERSEEELIQNLVEKKQKEIETIEETLVTQAPGNAEQDATMILALLRAQKNDLQKVAEEAKSYLKTNGPRNEGSNPVHVQDAPAPEKEL